jgi:DNA-binding MarR family transcriptional regulator
VYRERPALDRGRQRRASLVGSAAPGVRRVECRVPAIGRYGTADRSRALPRSRHHCTRPSCPIRTLRRPDLAKALAPLLPTLKETIIGLVRQDHADLTARQLAVLLICSLDDGPHTVRGLAGNLQVAKPAVTRALDRLEQFELVKRVDDPTDRRSINVGRTRAGREYVERLSTLMMDAAAVA